MLSLNLFELFLKINLSSAVAPTIIIGQKRVPVLTAFPGRVAKEIAKFVNELTEDDLKDAKMGK